jgi:GGDEF domain-containing protein
MPDREGALSVGVGVALFDPERPRALDKLIDEADRRMYEAKHPRQATEGGDDLETSPPVAPPLAADIVNEG